MENTKTIQKTRGLLTKKILRLFLKHIGIENGITRIQILKAIYGTEKINLENRFEREFYWHYRIRTKITALKLKKLLFIIEMPFKGKNVWFALKSKDELVYYQTKCAGARQGILEMEKLAIQSYQEKWHEQRLKEWENAD